jgi:methylenetetrahydrofolate reductase (NADPH)
MELVDYLQQKKKTYFSFELLPPLKGRNIEDIYSVIDPLIEFNPININVTYHQEEVVYKKHESGLMQKRTIRKRPGTVAISAAIKYRYSKPDVIPHLICGGFSKEDTENALIDLNFLGIRNILALRGDPQQPQRYFIAEENGHKNTLGLVQQIADMNRGKYLDGELQNSMATDFTVGVAGYPEKHIEAPNLKFDLQCLKKKVDAGANYVVTQMFFNNEKYYEFVELCRAEGIDVPIVPGLKPIRTKLDLKLLPQVFNIDIPQELVTAIHKAKDNDQVNKIGIEWAIKQSKDLKINKVPVIHYYTIGKSLNIKEIAKAVF